MTSFPFHVPFISLHLPCRLLSFSFHVLLCPFIFHLCLYIDFFLHDPVILFSVHVLWCPFVFLPFSFPVIFRSCSVIFFRLPNFPLMVLSFVLSCPFMFFSILLIFLSLSFHVPFVYFSCPSFRVPFIFLASSSHFPFIPFSIYVHFPSSLFTFCLNVPVIFLSWSVCFLSFSITVIFLSCSFPFPFVSFHFAFIFFHFLAFPFMLLSVSFQFPTVSCHVPFIFLSCHGFVMLYACKHVHWAWQPTKHLPYGLSLCIFSARTRLIILSVRFLILAKKKLIQ